MVLMGTPSVMSTVLGDDPISTSGYRLAIMITTASISDVFDPLRMDPWGYLHIFSLAAQTWVGRHVWRSGNTGAHGGGGGGGGHPPQGSVESVIHLPSEYVSGVTRKIRYLPGVSQFSS